MEQTCASRYLLARLPSADVAAFCVSVCYFWPPSDKYPNTIQSQTSGEHHRQHSGSCPGRFVCFFLSALAYCSPSVLPFLSGWIPRLGLGLFPGEKPGRNREGCQKGSGNFQGGPERPKTILGPGIGDWLRKPNGLGLETKPKFGKNHKGAGKGWAFRLEVKAKGFGGKIPGGGKTGPGGKKNFPSGGFFPGGNQPREGVLGLGAPPWVGTNGGKIFGGQIFPSFFFLPSWLGKRLPKLFIPKARARTPSLGLG